jgi:hypothetical protein
VSGPAGQGPAAGLARGFDTGDARRSKGATLGPTTTMVAERKGAIFWSIGGAWRCGGDGLGGRRRWEARRRQIERPRTLGGMAVVDRARH